MMNADHGDNDCVTQPPLTGMYLIWLLGLLLPLLLLLLVLLFEGPVHEGPIGGPHSGSESELPAGETR